MRQGNEPQRIGPICMEIADLWANHPQMRLGQLISNIYQLARAKETTDIFYMDDEDVMELLRHHLQPMEGTK